VYILVVCVYCVATGAALVTRCRSGENVANKDFRLWCLLGKITIVEANVGYNAKWAPRAGLLRFQQCSPDGIIESCNRERTESVMHCNGHKTCRFPQAILNFPPEKPLCENATNGNFIRIEYYCSKYKRLLRLCQCQLQ